MSEWQAPGGASEPYQSYSGPPETSAPLSPYAPYGPQFGYPPPGYPMAGYPPGYPGTGVYPGYATDPRDVRPGVAMASAVLAFVNAGLLILAGGLLLLGASIISDVEDATSSHTNYGVEIALDGTANLVAAALLIAGGVMLTGRKPAGRGVLTVGNGIVLALTVYWLVRFGSGALSVFIVYALLFAGVAAVSLVLAWLRPVSSWLTSSTGAGRT